TRAMTDRRPAEEPFTVHRGATPPPPALAGAVVAIGNFDGVHRGHRALIDAARERARTLDRPAAALTFEPHPRSFLPPEVPLFRRTAERAALGVFAACGLNAPSPPPSAAARAAPAPLNFTNDLLLHRLGFAGAAVVFDSRFGKTRGGPPALRAAEGARR